MTIWHKNYLGDQTQPWARQVQKEIDNSKSAFQTAEVNNVKRDQQLASSLRQVQASTAAASQAAIDAANAAAAAAAANSTAITANSNAISALQGLGSLDEATSTYKINAANVTVGSLSGDRISGGEIIGTTLKTASSGRRVEIESTSTAYYDESNNFTGRILGAGTDRGSTLELTSGASGELQIWNGGVIMYGAGGTYAALSDNGFAVGGNRLYTIGANIEADGQMIASDTIITGGSLTRTILAGGGTTGASINNTGNFIRTSSSQRYKTDIQALDIDLNDLYAVEPKTFKRIEEVEQNGQDANIYPGFIAEELAGTSLDKFVFYSKDEEGNERPEGIHYPELTAALLLAIKDLNNRITELENRVQ